MISAEKVPDSSECASCKKNNNKKKYLYQSIADSYISNIIIKEKEKEKDKKIILLS